MSGLQSSIVKAYISSGSLPCPKLLQYIEFTGEMECSDLCRVNRIIVAEFAALPHQPCFYARNRHMQRVLARFCQEMYAVEHPSLKQMAQLFNQMLEEVGANITKHNRIAVKLFRDMLRYLYASVNYGAFNTDEAQEIATVYWELFAHNLRPMVQLIIDTLTSSPVQPCVYARLQTSVDIVRRMIALMSDTVHPVVGTVLAEYERFNQEQKDALGLFEENVTNLIANLGNRYASYVVGRPFDTAFPLRVRAYLCSRSCPVSFHPLVQAILGTLQQGPDCLNALTCRECRHEHVLQQVQVLTAIARNMPRQIPGVIQALEEIRTSLEQLQRAHELDLFMIFMIMRRILQNVAD